MKAIDFRKKTAEELKEEIIAKQRELFNLRLQKAFGQVKSAAFKKARREIARIKTILHERTDFV